MTEKEFTWDYDPVKQPKGGVEASKVIWSTKSLMPRLKHLRKVYR